MVLTYLSSKVRKDAVIYGAAVPALGINDRVYMMKIIIDCKDCSKHVDIKHRIKFEGSREFKEAPKGLS